MARKNAEPRTFNVALSPELAGFVRDRVASGMYASASEVVREALRILAQLGKGVVAEGPSGYGLEAQEAGLDRSAAASHIRQLWRLRAGKKLGTTSVRDLIDDGRR